MGDMEHFQFLFIQVKQITVLYYTSSMPTEGFYRYCAGYVHVLQCLIGGSHVGYHLEFLLFRIFLVISFPHQFPESIVLLRIHTSPWGVWSRYTSSMLCCNLSKE